MAMILSILVVVAAVVQIVVPFFVNPFASGRDIVAKAEPTRIGPAPYAFSIWGPIFALSLVFAVYQVLPANVGLAPYSVMTPFALVLFGGASLWLTVAQYGPRWATMPILLIMAICANIALFVATSAGLDGWISYVCVVLPFALYAGWTLCATFVNFADVAPVCGFRRFGLGARDFAVLSLVVAAALAALLLWAHDGEPAFALTVIWALVAIVVAANQRGYGRSIAVTAGVGAALMGALAVLLNI